MLITIISTFQNIRQSNLDTDLNQPCVLICNWKWIGQEFTFDVKRD